MMQSLFAQVLAQCCCGSPAPPPPPPPPLTPTYLLLDFEWGDDLGSSWWSNSGDATTNVPANVSAEVTLQTQHGAAYVGSSSNFASTPSRNGYSNWGAKFAVVDGLLEVVINNPSVSRFRKINFLYNGGLIVTAITNFGARYTLVNRSFAMDPRAWFSVSFDDPAQWPALPSVTENEYIERLEFDRNPIAGGVFGIDQIELASAP